MAARNRILIAEDHTLVREGLRLLLQMNPELEVVAEVDNGRDAVRFAGETTPDLVLMDLSMPGMNGIEAIAEIKARYPKIKIVVLTVHTNEEYIHACIRGGANGYIVKDATRDQFMSAVHEVLLGHTHLCSVATEKIIGWFMTGAKTAGQWLRWIWGSSFKSKRAALLRASARVILLDEIRSRWTWGPSFNFDDAGRSHMVTPSGGHRADPGRSRGGAPTRATNRSIPLDMGSIAHFRDSMPIRRID